MTAAGGTASAALEQHDTGGKEPMARNAKAHDDAQRAAAAADDAAPDTIKARLTITPHVVTELEGGAAELLDLERQGLVHEIVSGAPDDDAEGATDAESEQPPAKQQEGGGE